MKHAFALAAFTLALAAGASAQTTLDLADIVGGGDGSGTGANAGVHVTNGSTTTTQTGAMTAAKNVFVAADNPLVDGVVVPDGGSGGTASVPISSTGLAVTGVSDATDLGANTWDHVWNGENFGTSTIWSDGVLGMHANKGITFDLHAIGAAHGGLVANRFVATPITGSSSGAQADYYAYVDGALVASASLSGADQFATGFTSVIPNGARFLTLLVSSDGVSSGDWTGFLNAEVDLVVPLTLGQMDTFDTGRDGWQRGDHLVEAGDGFLRLPGSDSSGGYIISFHQHAQWSGDYPAAGVERVRIDLRNEGTENLTVYLAFGNSPAPSGGGKWIATATPVALTAGAGWGTYDVPIGPGDFVSVNGGGTYASVMPNVVTMRILHNDQPAAQALTEDLDAWLDIDNVEALPEPAGALAAGALLLAGLTRCRARPCTAGN